jgi:tRNA (guanine37-N1)-methyltransferase
VTLKFSVVTLFPEMIEQALQHGVIGQALKTGKIEVNYANPRTFTRDVHHAVDDRPYGGGDGMVMLGETMTSALASLAPRPGDPVVLMSPQGVPFSQGLAQEWAGRERVTLISARYAGVDQRFINKSVTHEISIGDYVLSGGELPVLVLIDAIARFLPGVLGHQQSALRDSFGDGLLEAPQFTRPPTFEGQGVPAVLTSGHHQNIERWRQQVAVLTTLQKRPDLILKKWPEPPMRKSVLRKAHDFWRSLSAADREVLGLHLSESEFEK